MRREYVSGLVDGARVEAPFALRSKELRVSRNGDPYLALEVADRSGSIPGVLFRPTEDALAVPVGAVVQVRGTVTTFRGLRRLRIDDVVSACEWDPADIVASTTRCIDELRMDLRALASGVKDAELRGLTRAVFGEKSFFERFTRCPGSRSGHHAYLGGLLEHTVAVASICADLSRCYPEADADLLVTAALLHDIGRCEELSFDVAVEYTDEGRLLGHEVLGVRRLRETAANPPGRSGGERMMLLEHAILSHHGGEDRGMREPSTLEALLLAHADAVDSAAGSFLAVLSGPVRVGEAWTDASNVFHRALRAAPAACTGVPPMVPVAAQTERRSA